jgi:ribonucleoside-diphosphate reductase alpha chain
MWLGVESIEDTGQTEEVYCCVVPGSESFTLGNGLITSNCFLFRARDSREGWSETLYKCCNSLMTGGGIGVVYSDVRPEDSYITGLGGRSTGPLALMKMNNETGRYVRQGGSRRSAIWAGLHWNHPDVFRFMEMKRWDEVTLLGKSRDFNFPAPMDGTNISVILDSDFFAAYADPEWKATYRTWGSSYSVDHNWAHDVYWGVVRGMLRDGEPGFSVDVGDNEGENLRNACTEVTSRDDSDMCNLGSLNLAAFRTREEFAEGVELGTAFLMCGTLYSKLPIEEMYRVREKNRRLGLGLMGVHEWLLKRGKSYGPDPELGEWMEAYALSGGYSHRYADRLSVSRPVATRAVVDHGISSTINLPPWGSDLNNPARVTEFGRLLLKYLPELRGITAYPDGSRGGQPLTRVPYEEARSQLGVEFVDQSEASCKDGVCGT